MTTAYIGYQTRVAYNGADLAQTVDVTGPSAETAAVKVTNADSASAYHEFIAGIEDPGEITVQIVYLKTIMTTLRAARRTTGTWRLTFPDGGSTFSASGFLTKVAMGEPLEDRMTIDVTIKLSGALTWTAA